MLVGTELCPLERGAGGLENLVVGWANELSLTHDVLLASAQPTSVSELQVEVFRSPSELGEIANSQDVDCVVLNNRPQWAHFLPCPSVGVFHNDRPAWSTPDFDAEDLSAVQNALSYLHRKSAVSAYLANKLKTDCHSDFAVTTPFVDAEFLTPLAEEKKWPVLYSGRLLWKKGIAEVLALAADPKMATTTIAITNFLMPWGEPTAEHREIHAAVAQLPNVVLIDPPSSRKEMAAVLASAQVVIVPSQWQEPFGLVALESVAVGTPVAISGTGGLGEAAGECGIVADFTDASAAATVVLNAASAGVCDEQTRANHLARFTRQASTKKLAQLLADVFDERSGS